MSEKTNKLRRLLKEQDIILVPGAYDAMSAKLIENAGFSCVFVGGFGLSASLFGQPDVGMITLNEITTQVGRIADAVKIPVLADAEDGYGGVVNVQRTVREFEKSGAAGIFLEDQAHPVMCGSLGAYKKVVPMEEMVIKIKAALDARRDPDFLIAARTDSDIISLDEQIRRCNAYKAAGADLVMPLAAKQDDFKALVDNVKSPLWVILAPQIPVSVAYLRSIGFKGIIIYPVEALLVAVKAVSDLMKEMAQKETISETWAKMTPPGYGDFFKLMLFYH